MPTLSSLLVSRGVASMQAVEDAIARQVIYGDDLATNVLEVGAAREDDVTRLAAESLALFPLPTGKLVLLDPAVLRLLAGEVALRYGIFPIEKRGSDLVVATSEPLSQNVEEDLGFLLNLNLRPMYALHVRIMQALADHYGLPFERRYKRLLAKLEGRRATETEPLGPGGAPRTEPPPGAEPKARASWPAGVPHRAKTIPGGFPAPASVAPPAAPSAPRASAPPGVAGSIPPERPTLRGLPPVQPDEPWGPAPDQAPSALPATIDLSPRPPAAAPSQPPRAPSAPPAPPASTTPAATAPSTPVARAPSVPPAAPAATTSTAPSAPPAAGIPAALQMRSPARDVRPPPARARRKGPFPASLAEEEIQSAVTTDAVLDVLFDFAQQYFEYAALFVVHGDIAEGRDAAGRGADRARVSAVGIPLDLPSTLAAARDRRIPVIADLAPDGLDAELLSDLGRAPAIEGAPASPTAPSHRAPAAVIPIVVRGRAVALLFGDDAPAPVDLGSIGEVIAFAALAGASIERIILRKKMGGAGASARLPPAAAASVAPRADSTPAARIEPGKTGPAEPAPTAALRPSPAAPVRPGVAALARMFAPAAPGPTKSASTEAPAAKAARTATAAPEGAKPATPPGAPSPPHDEPPAAPVLVAPVSPAIEAPAEPGENAPAQSPAFEPFDDSPEGGELLAIALQTPSIEDAITVVPTGSEPPGPAYPEQAPQGTADAWGSTASASPRDGAHDLSESSGDALTVALLVHAATPPPTAETSPAPEAPPARENETQIVPDDALETVQPGEVAEPSVPIYDELSLPIDVEPSAAPVDVEPSAAPVDVEPSAAPVDVEPGVSIDDEPTAVPVDFEPGVSIDDEPTAVPVDFEPGVSIDGEPTAGRASTPADHPSLSERPASSRPSVPLVVDVFADASGGLASAIAIAAEEASARAARSAGRATPEPPPPPAAAPVDSPLPETSGTPETLTEGFPAVAAERARLALGLSEDIVPAADAAPAPASAPPAAAEAEDRTLAPFASLTGGDATNLASDISSSPSASSLLLDDTTSESAGAPAAPNAGDDAAPDHAAAPSAPIPTTPTPAEPASPWAAVPLDALLHQAARGADVADARAELRCRAERNLAPLLAHFPGPLEQDRHRSAERLPPASQCGALLQAFAHAGARGAATIAVLARHDDVDVRFWAAHLLGEIESPEAADGLLAFMVDPDAAVRRIALRSAGSILAASLPGRPLEAALGYLARDAQTPMRERIAAIDAMGQLRLPFFVPVLIGLLGAVPDEVGESARRALLVLTRQDFGRDAARWNDWWGRNDARHRIEWLIDALMHDTQSIRRAAGDELKSLTKEYFGYYDDLPRRERERAQERYREWWERDGRARFK